MSNFISNLQSLLLLWQQASLYPKVMSALILFLPLIITLVGMVMITRQVRRGGKWTD